MIYLCAQPDSFYFLWQVEILINNLNNLKVKPENIHVLIGYDAATGINIEWTEFASRNSKYARFHFYSDGRISKKYLSSIRPHIIRKHLERYPEIERERILYHDSDIIFRRLPDLKVLDENTWYVSDTRSYTGISHIREKGSQELLTKMCNIVGIPEAVVEINDGSSGGAQYIMGTTTKEFWANVERDSEEIYCLIEGFLNDLSNESYVVSGRRKSSILGERIQAWLSDMWALLWNAWKLEIKTEITDELSFCLASDNIQKWEKATILHYTGYITPQTFNKLAFQYFYPYYDDFSYIDQNSASFPLIKLIKEIKVKKDRARTPLNDTSILIPIRIDSESRTQNLQAVLKFINRNFSTRIIIHEVDSIQKIDQRSLPDNCAYYFEVVDDVKMHRTKINNDMILKAETPIIVLYDADIICAPEQLLEAVEQVRNGVVYASPYDGRMVALDESIKKAFVAKPEIGLLEDNIHFFQYSTKRSWGGICVLDRQQYILSGMENENFRSWGPEDLERVKRLRILGLEIRRIKGVVFHLPHERLLNSGYFNADVFYQYQDEYQKISNMTKSQLLKYISTWTS